MKADQAEEDTEVERENRVPNRLPAETELEKAASKEIANENF